MVAQQLVPPLVDERTQPDDANKVALADAGIAELTVTVLVQLVVLAPMQRARRGVDLFILETFSYIEELTLAIDAIRSFSSLLSIFCFLRVSVSPW